MIKQFGTNYGSFYYPEDLNGLNENSIIYCIGAGEDISHDIEIAHQLNSDVYIFDPTPRAIQHVNLVKSIFNNELDYKNYNDSKFGGGDINYWNKLLSTRINSNKIKMYNYGIHTTNEILKFYEPSNKDYVSHSLVHGMKSDEYIFVQVKNLKTVMKELNHRHIDLLKMDIEGSECDVINQMLLDGIFPKYIAVEFDLAYNGERIKDINKCNDTIQNLLKYNYELIYQNHSDYTFRLK